MIDLGTNKIRIVEIEGQGCDVYQGTTLIHKHPDYVKGHPYMTSNTAPSPYVAYSNSVASTTYAAYKAFNGSNTNTNRWVSATGKFNTDGTVIGAYPYLYLNLGSVANRKRFSRFDITVDLQQASGTYPRIVSLGYSSTNNNDYVYQRCDTPLEMWQANDGTITFYFEAPSTAMQHWSLSVIENNGASQVHIKQIRFYEDVSG